jgi:Domain of unknown function (DUF4412)
MEIVMMLRALVFAAAIAFANGAAAQERPADEVEYSADTAMETEKGVIQGRVYHSRVGERRELNMGNMSMPTITRRDQQVTWQLMPQQKAYTTLKAGSPQAQAAGDTSGWKVEMTVVGTEEIEGHKTSKTKIVAQTPDGGKFGGFWWTTAEGVTVKMDMLGKVDGKELRVKTTLRNLVIAKQDPALFEIPAGYKEMKMDFGSMMGGAMPGMRPPSAASANADTDATTGDKGDRPEKSKRPAVPSLGDLGKFIRH